MADKIFPKWGYAVIVAAFLGFLFVIGLWLEKGGYISYDDTESPGPVFVRPVLP